MRASAGCRATKCCSSARPTSTARRPNSPPPKRARTCAPIATSSTRSRRTRATGFQLSFDHFGRSSNPPNHKLTQHFGEVLEKNGLIEERVSKQIYSIDDKRFLPDRYVEGTCPNCGFERARGDQCDNCETLLDPIELINPRSTISGSTNVEVRDTAHLFLLQPQDAGAHPRLGRQGDRLAAAGALDRLQMARRRPDRPLDHARSGLGHPGHQGRQGRARASRTRSSTSGSMRRSNTSARPSNGPKRPAAIGSAGGAPTRARTTSPTSSSWARTTSPSTP